MIELVSAQRCIRCDVCIRICPTDVFAHGADRLPVIKHQDQCQTCFMCEAWCPTDALFVAPQAAPVPEASVYRDEAWLIAHDMLGSYRRELGWDQGRAALAADGRSVPDADNGLSPPGVAPLGLANRRGAEAERPQYDIGFEVAYRDEAEASEDGTARDADQP